MARPRLNRRRLVRLPKLAAADLQPQVTRDAVPRRRRLWRAAGTEPKGQEQIGLVDDLGVLADFRRLGAGA